MIRPSEISVVVQGAVNKELTPICLNSIRKYLPGAEIILSTWEGTDVEELDYDKVLLNKDPGANGYIRLYPQKQVNNLNRQLVSTQEGLKVATKPYCMKLRSDMELRSAGFLDYYNLFGEVRSDKSLLKSRVMVEGLTTCWDNAFCIGDWWTFGRRDDLVDFYDVPLSEEKSGEIFFDFSPSPVHLCEDEDNDTFEVRKSKPYLLDVVCQYPPEQYIAYHFLRKHFTIRYSSFLENTTPNKLLTNSFITHDLICIENKLSGIYLKKAENVCAEQASYYSLPLVKWYQKTSKCMELPDLSEYQKRKEEQKATEARYLSEQRYYDVMQTANIIGNYQRNVKVVKSEQLREIEQEDITFVVSGIIHYEGDLNAKKCLSSIRKFFPKSRIILSIWDNSDISGLDNLYDELVFSSTQDATMKYSVLLKPEFKLNTVNGQQLCVHSGMLHVTTPYVVRMRTDFYLTSDNFLKFYNKWNCILNAKEEAYTIFDQRILSLRIVARDSRFCNGDFVYQLSDFFQCGLTTDVLKLWTGVQFGREELNYFEDNKDTNYFNPCRFNHRYTAEQNFFLNCIKNSKIGVCIPEYYLDRSTDELVFQAEKVYASNIICASQKELGLVSKFDEEQPPFNLPEFLSHERLLEMYLYNVDPFNEAVREFLREKYRPIRLVQTDDFRVQISAGILYRKMRMWVKKLWFKLSPVARNFMLLRQKQDILLDSVQALNTKVYQLSGQLEETKAALDAVESELAVERMKNAAQKNGDE